MTTKYGVIFFFVCARSTSVSHATFNKNATVHALTWSTIALDYHIMRLSASAWLCALSICLF